MKLASIRLQNFRSCRDLTVEFDDYTCLVGQNGAGKSTILTALNIFFRNAAGVTTSVTTLTEEDFCNRDTSIPIVITAEFRELSAEETNDFEAYVRQDRLIVSARATWDPSHRCAEVKQCGARLVMRAFAPFFEQAKAGAKVVQLKELYAGLRGEFKELPAASTKGDMEAALHAYEEAHAENCELLESEDQFYGYTKGANRLAKYYQWVYVPAVKDAASEQDESKNSALGELLQRTLRPSIDFTSPLEALRRETTERYASIVDGQRSALKTASESLQARLRGWAHQGARVELQWNTESDKAVAIQAPAARAKIGDGPFIGDVPRMGHGLQRAFIVTVLQELAATGGVSSGPRLLLGFEEPELYQHPPQARHLASVLEQLSHQGAQVVITTHSPYFVSGRGFESIRLVRAPDSSGAGTAKKLTLSELAAAVADASGTPMDAPTTMMANVEQILQPSLNELFFLRSSGAG